MGEDPDLRMVFLEVVEKGEGALPRPDGALAQYGTAGSL